MRILAKLAEELRVIISLNSPLKCLRRRGSIKKLRRNAQSAISEEGMAPLYPLSKDQHTEVSRRSLNLFSVTEVAARIGADPETVTDWVKIGAIDRAVFGGGRFSKNELLRAALVFELVKFGLSLSCARDIVREMEYDLQQIWEGISRHFNAYAIAIPTNRKWLVSWCWMRPAAELDPFPVEDQIILPVSDILGRVTDETKQV